MGKVVLDSAGVRSYHVTTMNKIQECFETDQVDMSHVIMEKNAGMIVKK